jgi:hypothetical protein
LAEGAEEYAGGQEAAARPSGPAGAEEPPTEITGDPGDCPRAGQDQPAAWEALRGPYLALPRAQRRAFLDWVPELVKLREQLSDPDWLEEQLAELLEEDDGAPCVDCGADTLSLEPDELTEWYMVHDAVWKAAGAPDGYLCIGCLETRLGRTLSASDFTAAPVNDPWSSRSDRLVDRLTAID